MRIEDNFYEGGTVEAKYPKLEVFKFPENMTTLTHIGDSAFFHCTNLRSINLPDSIVSIGDNALSTTTQMMKYTMTKLPENLTRIGEKAFQKSLISLTSLPKSLTSIGYRAFNDCPNVQIIEFGGDSNWAVPSKLTTIGKEAFRNAGNGIVGDTIIIRQSVTTIEDTPFTNYGGSDNRITVYYTHLTGFKYTAADLGVADVQPLTFEQ
jgi:hypothetical protein